MGNKGKREFIQVLRLMEIFDQDLVADAELDAVMVATGDHQHARILAEVARAGKDAYCEKPLAMHFERLIDAVSDGLAIDHAVLDPLGVGIPPGPLAYEQTIERLADTLAACLYADRAR